jgi:SAM-dependent methyltransferase
MTKTLQYYDKQAMQFIEDTQKSDMSVQYDSFLTQVQLGGLILDLGCGSGRDSAYFLKQGYQVCAVDGSAQMCKFATKYIGQAVNQLTFEQLNWKNQFDGVWACASLLHCERKQLPSVLQRVADSMKPKAILYASFKYGTFSGWRNGRYFTDLNEERLQNLLQQVPDLQLMTIYLTGDVRPERQQEQWLNILLQKRHS